MLPLHAIARTRIRHDEHTTANRAAVILNTVILNTVIARTRRSPDVP